MTRLTIFRFFFRSGVASTRRRRLSTFFFAATVAFLCLTMTSAFDAFGADIDSERVWDETWLQARSDALKDEFDAFEHEHGFNRSFKVKTSERFIFVYDVSDAYLEWLRALTTEVAKAFDKFCERLELETTAPKEPLTVVVLATQEEFDAYAASLPGMNFQDSTNRPVGFFYHGNNRSVLYDMTDAEAARVAGNGGDAGNGRDFSRRQINAEARSIRTRNNAGNNTSAIVHEVSHQLAFNCGIFSLYDRQPDWVVEGMAMTFEPTNDDAPLGWRYRGSFPVNEGRLQHFILVANRDDNLSILDEVVRSDRFEDELSSDGYAASWALFYYCYRRKPKELKKYIETLQKRPRGKKYSEIERMEEFEECFGKADVFGKQFVRWIKGLKR